LEVQICGDEPENAAYLGSGFLGVQAMLETAVTLLSVQIQSVCARLPGAPTLGPRFFVGQGTASVGSVFNEALTSATRVVEIEIGGDDSNVRVYKLSGSETEGEYGFWAISYDDGTDRFPEESRKLVNKRGSLMVPEFDGRDRCCRISIKRGLTYSLYAYEVI
jgi:hypothetical protein